MATPHGFMPGASVHNIAPGSSDPAIVPVGTIDHIAVSNAPSLFGLFSNDGGIESHFYVRTDGTFDQYRSIFFEADAQFDGNSFFRANRRVGFISIEHQGGVPNGTGTWTDAQVATNKRIKQWVHDQAAAVGVDIPWRKAPAWNEPGHGYHALFDQWNLSHHSCPGASRIVQWNATFPAWFGTLNHPPKPTASPLVLLGFNCYVASNSAALVKQIDTWWKEHGLHGAALSEARTHRPALAQYAHDNGLHLFQRQPSNVLPKGAQVNDQGDSAILLAKDIKATNHRVAEMHLDWKVTGHDKVHTPREYETVGADHNGQPFRLQAPHWPTHGFKGANAKAFAESASRAKRWLGATNAPSLIVGDLNEQMATIAKWFGKGYTVAGSGIDMLVARNVARVEHQQLEKGPSDHHGQLYTVHLA